MISINCNLKAEDSTQAGWLHVIIAFIGDEITYTNITEPKPINQYLISQLPYQCILIVYINTLLKTCCF